MGTELDRVQDEELMFCRSLVEHVPGLAEVMSEHLKNEGGELLPYMFLSLAAAWAEQNTAAHKKDVTSLLSLLNCGLACGKGHVPNLVAVGFVESLEKDTPLVSLLSGDLLAWYEFDYGLRETAPVFRNGPC